MCVEVPLEATSGGVQSEHPARYVRRPQVLDQDPATHVSTRTPPCIRGQIIGTDQHDHLLLKSLLLTVTPDLDISDISDQLLADYLCQTRSVFPFQRNEHVVAQVECLLTLRAVSSPRSHLEYIIVRSLADEDAPLTVMQAALVRDCLREADRERLDAACDRPCCNVKKNEYYAGHGFDKLTGGRALSWKIPTRHAIYQAYTWYKLLINNIYQAYTIDKQYIPGIVYTKYKPGIYLVYTMTIP
jgi:hypothetical protein